MIVLPKTEKTLERWRTATDENWATVEAVLLKYGFTMAKRNNGSHFTFIHEILAEIAKTFPALHGITKYAPDGQIIIIVHNNRVPGYCLRKILEALHDITDYCEIKGD